MTREKKNSDWDDLKFMLDLPQDAEQDSSPTESASEPVSESVFSESTVESETSETSEVGIMKTDEQSEVVDLSDGVETTVADENVVAQDKAADDAASEKKEKKASAKSAEKDAEVKKPRATRASKKDAAEDESVKPAPKRARGRRPAASEKELEVSKTFGDVISQIASVAKGKRSSKKSAPVESEPFAETSADLKNLPSVDEFDAGQTQAEPKTPDSTDDVVFEAPATADAPTLPSPEEPARYETDEAEFLAYLREDKTEELENAKPVVDDSLPDDFWSVFDSDAEQENLDDILWNSKKEDSEQVEPTEPFEEAINAEEDFVDASELPSLKEDKKVDFWNLDEEVDGTENFAVAEKSSEAGEQPKTKENDLDDFWGFDDSLDISWGVSPASKVEERSEPVQDDVDVEEQDSESEESEATPCERLPETEESVVDVPEPVENKPVTVDEVNFDNPDDLSSFFSFSSSDDLGFTPRKQSSTKPSREKSGKTPKRDAEAARPEKKPATAEREFVETDSAVSSDVREARDSRRRDFDEVEELREPRSTRNARRRDFEDVEEPRETRSPRDNRRRSFEEVEEPRQARPSRDSRRRDYENVEEPREARSARNNRRRGFDEEEEPRETRAPRNNRRRDYEDVEELLEVRTSRDSRCRDYDEVEEPRQARPSRDFRRRNRDEVEEPRETRTSRDNRRRDYEEVEEPRETRTPRDNRRRSVNAPAESAKETDVERKPERILPSWDEAIGYVVNFNLSRRMHRGRGGK